MIYIRFHDKDEEVITFLDDELHTYDNKIIVEIADNVITRMYNCISASDTEEGGKLIGNIVPKEEKILIKVTDYIDSGPRVDNSATHLHPDGNYQEAVFRVIESMDSEIEHLGSWHSHHCNGLSVLSDGDIAGYKNSVNNQQYNLDYFFVILITGFTKDKLEMGYYLFIRNEDQYYQIPEENIKVVPGESHFQEILEMSESLSLSCRYNQSSQIVDQIDPRLIEIIKEDRVWLKNDYPSANTFKNHRTGELFWKWEEENIDTKITFRYIYPKIITEINMPFAVLNANVDNWNMFTEFIPLDFNRFQHVRDCVLEAKSMVLNYNYLDQFRWF